MSAPSIFLVRGLYLKNNGILISQYRSINNQFEKLIVIVPIFQVAFYYEILKAKKY